MEVYICTNSEVARGDYDDGSGDRTGVNLAADAAFEAAQAAGICYDDIHFDSQFHRWNGGDLYRSNAFQDRTGPVVVRFDEDAGETREAAEALCLKVSAAHRVALREWEREQREADFRCIWDECRARIADGEFPRSREVRQLIEAAEALL